jgi:hypothetical protein
VEANQDRKCSQRQTLKIYGVRINNIASRLSTTIACIGVQPTEPETTFLTSQPDSAVVGHFHNGSADSLALHTLHAHQRAAPPFSASSARFLSGHCRIAASIASSRCAHRIPSSRTGAANRLPSPRLPVTTTIHAVMASDNFFEWHLDASLSAFSPSASDSAKRRTADRRAIRPTSGPSSHSRDRMRVRRVLFRAT